MWPNWQIQRITSIISHVNYMSWQPSMHKLINSLNKLTTWQPDTQSLSTVDHITCTVWEWHLTCRDPCSNTTWHIINCFNDNWRNVIEIKYIDNCSRTTCHSIFVHLYTLGKLPAQPAIRVVNPFTPTTCILRTCGLFKESSVRPKREYNHHTLLQPITTQHNQYHY